jgi:plasmid stabilization system protein ParE
MNFSFYPDAERELNEAVDYYNKCKEGLGLEFAKEIFFAVENIVSFPKAWTVLSKNTRRCLLNRFPYGIIYQIKEKEIIIIAVMHLNRKPKYWKKRKEF